MDKPFSFHNFHRPVSLPTPQRDAITSAYRRKERECLTALIEGARVTPEQQKAIGETARALVEGLREGGSFSGIAALVQEFALSSSEGVALMCLAEALLRIPDNKTRDALIRDKLSGRDWASHMGRDRTLFVNAATAGLVISGKLVSNTQRQTPAPPLSRFAARCSSPFIRQAVVVAMRMMGDQFVTGKTIGQALDRARKWEGQGFTYSYDMLGEAAMTAEDAASYHDEYEGAIHAIGRGSAGLGIFTSAGISVKLSALHPRYVHAKGDRVMSELLPRVAHLAKLAKQYDIGFNIDAEEQDRLDLSLDILEHLCLDPDLAGWDGIGCAVQAYGKRCPFVIDYLADLARRAGRRIMVRLVKGAYWDAEIKRTQVDGLTDFPVYTRKVHTDVSYIACARKLLAVKDCLFPQFATHNAQTVATIYHLAGPEFKLGDYEFQCLHGMGEPLYRQIIGRGKLDRPCRIYAPVGTHETLLAYLTRRLLENGANSSFVNRLSDASVSVETLIVDPVDKVLSASDPGAPHDAIALPDNLFADRANSDGLDLNDEATLAKLQAVLEQSTQVAWTASGIASANASVEITNPSDRRDVVGTVIEASLDEVASTVMRAAKSGWVHVASDERAAILERAADLMQDRMEMLMGLIIREAGKSAPNAIGEVREAIDFLRYYAAQGRAKLTTDHKPLGPVAAISPWNFPLAIFTGQVSAALMAGNPVLAKPAEETPLIAAEAVRILHEAGVDADGLQLVPGDGRIGASLVGSEGVMGVLFTGSTDVARKIQMQLAERLSLDGTPIPLIAETGGQNAMIVDSSALTEQVVANVILSAFDSAGQRCSAMRILCLQEDIADETLEMLKGALVEISVRPVDQLNADIGPVITAQAKSDIEAHIERLRKAGAPITQATLGPETTHGTFVAPTIIELDSLDALGPEVFGPVLHVLRYQRDKLDDMIDAINAMGYGLTFGLQTRIDDMINHTTKRAQTGNIYVNRNMIGAIVGVQPFGGHGLSGTGPKAGGPLYLGRLVTGADIAPIGSVMPDAAMQAYIDWLEQQGATRTAQSARNYCARSGADFADLLTGPVGETNDYCLHPRGTILLRPITHAGLLEQLAAALATGNDVVVEGHEALLETLAKMPAAVTHRIRPGDTPMIAGALVEGNPQTVHNELQRLAGRPGAVILTQAATSEQCAQGNAYRLDWLVHEVSVSIDTTAAGGNATLMALI